MNEIELKARELLAEMARGLGQPEYAYHIGCGGVLDKGDRKLIAPIIAALTPQWQPIESAPKDGMAVLATSAHMTGPNGEPVAWAAVFDQERGRWTATWDGEPLNDATHWQPLPAPPEVAA